MERNFFVLEDRVYADARFEGEPPRAAARAGPRPRDLRQLAVEDVGGGLRVGWIAARGPVRERIAMLKLEADFHTPTLTQHMAARWLAAGAHDRHVEKTLPFYRERRDALLAALERHLPGEYRADVPTGGHHVWVTLDRAVDERALYSEAARHGVTFTPGGAVTPERRSQTSMRLSFSAARAGRAGRGCAPPRSRHPRGAPPQPYRGGRPDVLSRDARRPRAVPTGRRAERNSAREKRLRNSLRTPSRWVRRAAAKSRRPAGVISAKKPRASSSHCTRSSSPARSRRSTRRVRPLRLSSTESASSDMRMRPPGALGQEQQDLVGGQGKGVGAS